MTLIISYIKHHKTPSSWNNAVLKHIRNIRFRYLTPSPPPLHPQNDTRCLIWDIIKTKPIWNNNLSEPIIIIILFRNVLERYAFVTLGPIPPTAPQKWWRSLSHKSNIIKTPPLWNNTVSERFGNIRFRYLTPPPHHCTGKMTLPISSIKHPNVSERNPWPCTGDHLTSFIENIQNELFEMFRKKSQKLNFANGGKQLFCIQWKYKVLLFMSLIFHCQLFLLQSFYCLLIKIQVVFWGCLWCGALFLGFRPYSGRRARVDLN